MQRKQTAQKTLTKNPTTTRRKTTTSTSNGSKKMIFASYSDMDAKIRQKAYELYLQRGGSHGDDMNDWLRAEKEVKKELSLV